VIEYVRRSPKKVSALFEGSDNNEGQGLWSMGPFLAAAPQGWFYLEELDYSRLFEQYVLPVVDLTNRVVKPAEARRSQAALAAKLAGPPAARLLHHNFFASMLLPGVSRSSQKAAFGQTAVDVAAIACALERYRIAHGKYAGSLSELVPELLAALPHDVINGHPLSYRLNPEGGYVLYSVGWNETDDRGTIKQTKSGGVEQSEGDWVWSNSF
jgi:type II secretory pathway pseudopilin PulG